MPTSSNSVAVLPFINMSSDPDNEYFSDGLTEEIINALTKIKGLQVTARTSSFAFKGKNEDIRTIGQQLGVEIVLEGSVRKAGQKVRITAQLINVEDGYHFWSETFDHQLEDIFAVQDSISIKIAEKLREHLGHFDIQENLVKSPTHNISAYQLYLKGRYHGNQWTQEGADIALKVYKQALSMAPDFALPYAGLADLYSAMGALNMMPAKEAFEQAKGYARKALYLNDEIPESHIALANIYFWAEWKFEEAYQCLYKALDLAPGNAQAQGFLGMFKAIAGNLEDGKVILENALRSDPLSMQLHYAMSAIHHLSENYEGVLAESEKVLQLNPNFIQANAMIGHAYYRLGQYDKALEQFESFSFFPNLFGYDPGWLACCYQKLGDHSKAGHFFQEALDVYQKNRLSHTPCISYTLVVYHINAQEYQLALDYLEKGMEESVEDFIFLKKDPTFRVLNGMTRFQNLIKKIDARLGQPFLSSGTREKYAHSKLTVEDAKQINHRLVSYMDQSKPYLDSHLCLRNLADTLEVNTNYLSQVINEKHNKNFFEFINEYRVAELKRKLCDPQNRQFTILSLAFECGFNSKTTFNTTFKKITGITPSQYLKQFAA